MTATMNAHVTIKQLEWRSIDIGVGVGGLAKSLNAGRRLLLSAYGLHVTTKKLTAKSQDLLQSIQSAYSLRLIEQAAPGDLESLGQNMLQSAQGTLEIVSAMRDLMPRHLQKIVVPTLDVLQGCANELRLYAEAFSSRTLAISLSKED